MDINIFNRLSDKDKNFILQEMGELYNIISDYPITIEEIKIFAEWHKHTGQYGDNLKIFLNKYKTYE